MKERYLKRNINTNDTYTTPNNNQPIKNRKSHIFPSSQNTDEEESYTCTAWNGPIIIELKWGQIFNMVSFVDCLRDWLTAWQTDSLFLPLQSDRYHCGLSLCRSCSCSYGYSLFSLFNWYTMFIYNNFHLNSTWSG